MNQAGNPELLLPRVPRAWLLEVVAALPPCLIGVEACSGTHHWARLFAAHGHTVRLMAPKLVTPYRMNCLCGKNDAADAATICAAVARPTMRFVPIKSEEQQSRLFHQGPQHSLEVRSTQGESQPRFTWICIG